MKLILPATIIASLLVSGWTRPTDLGESGADEAGHRVEKVYMMEPVELVRGLAEDARTIGKTAYNAIGALSSGFTSGDADVAAAAGAELSSPGIGQIVLNGATGLGTDFLWGPINVASSVLNNGVKIGGRVFGEGDGDGLVAVVIGGAGDTLNTVGEAVQAPGETVGNTFHDISNILGGGKADGGLGTSVLNGIGSGLYILGDLAGVPGTAATGTLAELNGILTGKGGFGDLGNSFIRGLLVTADGSIKLVTLPIGAITGSIGESLDLVGAGQGTGGLGGLASTALGTGLNAVGNVATVPGSLIKDIGSIVTVEGSDPLTQTVGSAGNLIKHVGNFLNRPGQAAMGIGDVLSGDSTDSLFGPLFNGVANAFGDVVGAGSTVISYPIGLVSSTVPWFLGGFGGGIGSQPRLFINDVGALGKLATHSIDTAAKRIFGVGNGNDLYSSGGVNALPYGQYEQSH